MKSAATVRSIASSKQRGASAAAPPATIRTADNTALKIACRSYQCRDSRGYRLLMTVTSRDRRGGLALGGVISARGLLALLCTAGGLLVVVLRTRLTFLNDDWYFLLQRPGLESHGGLDTLLAPHNGNIVVLLALLYKALVGAFGFGSQLPYGLVMGLTVAVLGVLVFALVEERLGPVVGLVAAAVVVFMGPAWEALLFFASFSHLGTLTLGVAALFVLESDTSARNAIACGLLVCAILLFTLAIPFIVGAVIVVVVRRRPAQLWIPAVPMAMFVLWWAFYGHKEHSGVTFGHIEHLPRYLFDAVSSGLASATGLVHGSLPAVVSSGHLLTVVALLWLVWWLLRGGRPRPWSLVFAMTGLTFWLLTGASAIPGRGAAASRYQVTSATLLILLAAELLRGIRIGRRGLAFVSAAAVLIVASNLSVMRRGFDFMRAESETAQVDLGALELAGPAAPPALQFTAPVARDPYLTGITAGRYFAQTRAHGSPPTYSEEQIAGSGASERQAADSVLANAYGIAARPTPAKRTDSDCVRLAAGITQGGPPLALSLGGTMVTNLTDVPLVIGVSHFAPSQLPVYIGFLAGHATTRVAIPTDSANFQWRLSLTTGGRVAPSRVAVCRA